MEIKMYILITDVDGSLLNSLGQLSEYTKEILLEFQKQGNMIILASGRSYSRMLGIAEDLQMDKYGGYIVDVNGIGAYDCKNKIRSKFYSYGRDELKDLFEYFKEDNVEIKFYYDAGIYTYLPEDIYKLKTMIRAEMLLPDDYPWGSGMFSWFNDNRDGYPDQRLIWTLDEVVDGVNKMALNHEKDVLLKVQERFVNSSFSKEYDLVFASPRQLDLIPKHISKGEGIGRILEDIKVDRNKIYIFGDSENDLSMMSLSRNAYAMGNADQELLDHVDLLTLSNDEDGVAYIAKTLLK